MPKPKPKTLPLGTISEGTLKNEDLIPAFIDAIDGVRISRKHRGEVRAINNRLVDDYQSALWECPKDELVSYDVERLIDILNDYVPNYCYFGAHDGDGACFGVWPTDEVPFHGPGTDDIGKGESLPVSTVSRFLPGHWLVVNDHGNATLYRKKSNNGCGVKWVECWSVV